MLGNLNNIISVHYSEWLMVERSFSGGEANWKMDEMKNRLKRGKIVVWEKYEYNSINMQ